MAKAAKKPAPKKPEPKPVGRPAAYRPEFAELAAKLCARGATDQELADFFDVSVRTMYRWKLENLEFCQALKVGKDLTDDRIERSLLERASGYRYVEQQAIKVKVARDCEKVEIIEVERAIPPDTTAMIFWLKNRRPEQWRDKREVEHSGSLSLAELVSASYREDLPALPDPKVIEHEE